MPTIFKLRQHTNERTHNHATPSATEVQTSVKKIIKKGFRRMPKNWWLILGVATGVLLVGLGIALYYKEQQELIHIPDLTLPKIENLSSSTLPPLISAEEDVPRLYIKVEE